MLVSRKVSYTLAHTHTHIGYKTAWRYRTFHVLYHLSIPPQPKPKYAVTIAVSSRTLFNMVAERKIYEEEGVENYVSHQVKHENEPLKPGAAFPFVKVSLVPCHRCGSWVWSLKYSRLKFL